MIDFKYAFIVEWRYQNVTCLYLTGQSNPLFCFFVWNLLSCSVVKFFHVDMRAVANFKKDSVSWLKYNFILLGVAMCFLLKRLKVNA